MEKLEQLGLKLHDKEKGKLIDMFSKSGHVDYIKFYF